MEVRSSGLRTPVPAISSQHSPLPVKNPKRRSAATRPRSSPVRSVAGPQTVNEDLPINAADTSRSNPGHNWRPLSGVEGRISIPSPLRRLTGNRADASLDIDKEDADSVFGERARTGVWSPMSRPCSAAWRPGSAWSSPTSAARLIESPKGAVVPGSPLAYDALSPLLGGSRPASAFGLHLPRSPLTTVRSPLLDNNSTVGCELDETPDTRPSSSCKESFERANKSDTSLGSPLRTFVVPSLTSSLKAFHCRPQTAQANVNAGWTSPEITASDNRPRTSMSDFSGAHIIRSPVSGISSTYFSRAMTSPKNFSHGEGKVRLRPGTAIPSSSNAEKLIHNKVDFVTTSLVVEPPEDDLVQILSFMRRRTKQMGVKLVDFLAPFDRYRQGSITEGEFFRALELSLAFRDLTDHERCVASSAFYEKGDFSQNIGAVFGPPRVKYLNFCTVVQPDAALGLSRRVVLADEHFRIMQKLDEEEGQDEVSVYEPLRIQNPLPSSPLAVNALAPSGDKRLRTIFSRILKRLRGSRASIREYFDDLEIRKFDPAMHSRARPTTPSLTKSIGCMSRTQFERCITNLCSSYEHFEEQDLAILFRKYEKNGEFNYFRFVRDIEDAEFHFATSGRGNKSPGGLAWPTEVRLGAATDGEISVPEWGRGSGRDSCTEEPVFTWSVMTRDRDGTSCPNPVY